MDARTTAAASSVGGTSLRLPPYLAMAVRTALRTTTWRSLPTTNSSFRGNLPRSVIRTLAQSLPRELRKATCVGFLPEKNHIRLWGLIQRNRRNRQRSYVRYRTNLAPLSGPRRFGSRDR